MVRINYKKIGFEDLIILVKASDVCATSEFIKRIQKEIFTFFRYLCPPNDVVSDLTQEALIKIVKNIEKLHNIKSYKSWSNRIAVNIFYDYLRRNKIKAENIESDEVVINNLVDSKAKPIEKCQNNELGCQIRMCIINLPLESRLAIILRELEGFSYQEIAKLTNSNLGTVKSRISRAREKLQVELSSYL